MNSKIIILAILAVFIISSAFFYSSYLSEKKLIEFEDDIEHFKYGSIGAEVDGYPYLIWQVLPFIFKDKIPNGYKQFGFITEKHHSLPVGISVRKYGIARVGFNCATCHTTTINNNSSIILGAPATKVDLQGYVEFLSATSKSYRFNASTILSAIEKQGIKLNYLDKLMYRHYIIPSIKKVFAQREAENAWLKTVPPHGLGRTDATNPWKQHFGIKNEPRIVATVDFPSIWNQQIRNESLMHWDGNNNSLTERNISAALAGGATEKSLDLESMQRVAKWLLTLNSPKYPFKTNKYLVAKGDKIFKKEKCYSCHSVNGDHFGKITSIKEIKTDSNRWKSADTNLISKFLTIGNGYPWEFKHYRLSKGYANQPLDGIWARSPYLHNGSIPTLNDLLLESNKRPPVFYTGGEKFDTINVGIESYKGFRFDTNIEGNNNKGHTYGTTLSKNEKAALLEYLKTL